MNNVTKLGLSAALGLFCAQPLSAQPGMPTAERHEGMGHMGSMHGDSSPFMMLLKSADLTPAQQAQVQQILQAHHTQMKSVMQQFHGLHEQIAGKLLASGPVAASDLAPLTQKASRLQERINQSMVDTALAVRNVLTPEQVSHLAQVHQQLQNLHAQIRNLTGSDSEDMSESSSN